MTFCRTYRLLIGVWLLSTPANAMLDILEPVDPKGTACAGLLQERQQASVGKVVVVLDMLPVTTNSSVPYQRGDTNLYTDRAGLVVLPIDAPSYTKVVKHRLPSWLLLSFDANGAHKGVLRRSTAIASRKSCSWSEAYIAIPDIPRGVKQELLKAFADYRNGGTGDPLAVPEDEDTRIERMFPASLDAELQNVAKGIF